MSDANSISITSERGFQPMCWWGGNRFRMDILHHDLEAKQATKLQCFSKLSLFQDMLDGVTKSESDAGNIVPLWS